VPERAASRGSRVTGRSRAELVAAEAVVRAIGARFRDPLVQPLTRDLVGAGGDDDEER
jgi:hypothetical protein